jgi:hypothetical protein
MIKNGVDTVCKSKINDKFFESKIFFLKDRTLPLISLKSLAGIVFYVFCINLAVSEKPAP